MNQLMWLKDAKGGFREDDMSVVVFDIWVFSFSNAAIPFLLILFSTVLHIPRQNFTMPPRKSLTVLSILCQGCSSTPKETVVLRIDFT